MDKIIHILGKTWPWHIVTFNCLRLSLPTAGRTSGLQGTANEAPPKPAHPTQLLSTPCLCCTPVVVSFCHPEVFCNFFLWTSSVIPLTQKPGAQYLLGADVVSVVLPSWWIQWEQKLLLLCRGKGLNLFWSKIDVPQLGCSQCSQGFSQPKWCISQKKRKKIMVVCYSPSSVFLCPWNRENGFLIYCSPLSKTHCWGNSKGYILEIILFQFSPKGCVRNCLCCIEIDKNKLFPLLYLLWIHYLFKNMLRDSSFITNGYIRVWSRMWFPIHKESFLLSQLFLFDF